MSLAHAASLMAILGFPRVSGDEPQVAPLSELLREFSPRERG